MMILMHIDDGSHLYAINSYCGKVVYSHSNVDNAVSWRYYKNTLKTGRAPIGYVWCQACLDSPVVVLKLLAEATI